VQDIQQLRVQGHTTQNQPLQTWENSSGNALGQVTGDGNLIVGSTTINTQMTKDGRMIAGDDLGVSTPDALLEVHRAETSSTRPTRGVHSLGQLTGALTNLVQWMVGELELRGSSAINALHTALRIRASNLNTGTPGSNAELRGADVEVINEVGAGSGALPKATGIQASVTNSAGKTITDAAALRLKVNNAGTITNSYSIYAEGPGVVHFEDFIEIKRPIVVPGTPPTDFVRLYSKTDGKLYAKNWSGVETELGSSGTGATIPTGSVIPFAGITAPTGWLLCNGAAVSRSTYSTLFGVIQTTYGVGDGSTTFNLPDLLGRTPIGAGQGSGLTNRPLAQKIGAETHTLTIPEMPSHNHTYQPGGSGTTAGFPTQAIRSTTLLNTGLTGGGQAHNNIQPSLALNYIIKT